MTTKCFVLRTSPVDFVKSELRAGRLRMGWAPHGTSLLNLADGKPRDKAEWEKSYESAWGTTPTTRRHAILRRMLDIQEGDVIVCPKMPSNRHFTLVKATGKYRFDLSPDMDDFGHILPVADQRCVSNYHDADAVTISDLFKSFYFRSPVVRVQDHKTADVLQTAQRLWESQNETDIAGDLNAIRKELLEEARLQAAAALIEEVRKKWSFEQFEIAIRQALEDRGYELMDSKIPRNGGDADMVFQLPLPGFQGQESPFSRTPVLIVQVKKKEGVDFGDVHGVKQLISWVPKDEGQVVVLKVLVSSAEKFTDGCLDEAQKHDVACICGAQAGLLLL